jgi:hypothetical protein
MKKIIFTLALASGVFTAYLAGSTRIVSTNQVTQNDLAYDSVPKKDTAKKATAHLAYIRFNGNDSLPKKDTASKKVSMDFLAKN